MNYYLINEETCALIPVNDKRTTVYELNNKFTVEQNVLKIINDSCLKYGSSYSGRAAATKYAIGYTHKSPICMNERTLNIFFPTKSPRINDCAWISYNNIFIYSRKGKECTITFKNNVTVALKISYLTIQNQLFRSSRLEYYLKNAYPQNCGQNNIKKNA